MSIEADTLKFLLIVMLAAVAAAALAWTLARASARAVQAREVEHACSPLRQQLIELGERLRQSEQERRAGLDRYDELLRRAEDWRDSLDAARDECAMLTERTSHLSSLQKEVDRLDDELEQSNQALLRESQQRAGLEREAARLPGLTAQLQTLAQEHASLRSEFAELRARSEAERRAEAERLQLLMQARESLTAQFKSLANDILEEKSQRFAEQNRTNLGSLLDPLRVQLNDFKGKVEEVYVQEGKDRSALAEQVRQLQLLNRMLSDDAKNLTEALKGSSKTQGTWGELVLERVLEAAGLRRGHEYHVQDSHTREDGSRAQPDVVIHLPEERRLVVDAKVSLLAYEQHVAATTDEAREQALRRHLDSIRMHVKGLSAREYQALYQLKSLDFVLMFVPIESAFMLAVGQDAELFMEAWNRNVLLVSPSTLLFVVRTVAHLWRQEAQNRNAQEIARRGADLYDKLVAMVDDFQSIGMRLGQAQTAFESAQKRLATGRGNVIRQAEMLRDLGVRPQKALAGPLLDGAMLADEDRPLSSEPSAAEVLPLRGPVEGSR